ncbi:MAG: hypothetical protein HVK27_00560 [Pelagibacteraceae bacterium]|jgi:hypothetical protein|nr:hypothetical protein [Pelagibacteraceae bacterium]
MKKIFLLTIVFNILLVSCQHIEKKTSAILEKEEALEKWIGQPKSELLEVYGLPTEVKKDDQGIEFLIYTSKKFGIIKCQREFAIGLNGMVDGFSSRGCIDKPL